MAARPTPLWARLLMGFGAAVAGAGMFASSLDEVTLACTRARCVVSHTFPAARDEVSLRDYRGAEKVVSGGKSRTTRLVLIDGRGDQRGLLTVTDGDANILVAHMQELLAGRRDELHHHQGRMVPLLVMGVLIAVGGLVALVLGVRDLFRGERRREPATPRHAPAVVDPNTARKARRWIYVMVGVALLTAAVNLALVSAMTGPGGGGKLTIEARQRCEFGGITLLPGAVMEQVVAPGEHVVRVWTPDTPGQWTAHRVEVVAGGDARFVCAPP